MFRSTLLINVGNNPDQPRPGRLWLRNIYHVHQRLCMAFPSQDQVKDDPEFLQPFKEGGFPLLRNPKAVPRDPRHSFLFRIDHSIEDNCPRAIILVQSEAKPDWDYAFQNARIFLAADPEMKQFNPTFRAGDNLRFRIRVNLSKKSKTSKDGADLRKLREKLDAKGRQKAQGKRVALTWDKDQKPDEVIRKWFASKSAPNGFELRSCNLLHLGWVAGDRPKKGTLDEASENENSAHKMKFRSAVLEGTLTVTDAEAFASAIASGIGSAKAFGFGLLSVACPPE